MTADCQCEFQCNISSSGKIFCNNFEYNETVQPLFINSEKAYDSVMREVLYIILIEFGIPMEIS
jgi:hypothetical protein